MSSFKKIKRSDIFSIPIVMNKQWEFEYNNISNDNLINFYNGKKSTILFGEENEYITNGEYDKLIYDYINHSFYQNYTNKLSTSSLKSSLYYENITDDRPTSSYFEFKTNNFIPTFPTSSGSEIKVIKISPKIFGERIKPLSLSISSSRGYIRDDGYGNIKDSWNNNIGNVFYSQGTIIISDPNFQSIINLPPVAFNITKDIYRNDFGNPDIFLFSILESIDLRGNTLISNSINLEPYSNLFSTGSNNDVIFNLNGDSLGTYNTNYYFSTIDNQSNIMNSNIAHIIINVSQASCDYGVGLDFQYTGSGDFLSSSVGDGNASSTFNNEAIIDGGNSYSQDDLVIKVDGGNA